MANIFVDPVIVTIPDDETDRDKIVAWEQSLELWLEEFNSGYFEWLYSIDVALLLQNQERFASAETLRSLVNRYRLDINPRLLGREIDKFFRNEGYEFDPTKDIGSKLTDLGYMESGDPVIVEPEEMIIRWPDFIRQDMLDLLVTCSVCKQAGNPLTSDLYIATSKLSTANQEIVISSIIDNSIDQLTCKIGDSVQQAFPLLCHPDKLQQLIDIVVLWRDGKAGVIYAIEKQFRLVWLHTVFQPLTFIFGPNFLKSVADHGLHTNQSALLKIVECAAYVIADPVKVGKKYELEQRRKTKSGNSPARIRQTDNAEAWRLRVTKHGAGWRLHYWHIPGPDGGSIEFSNICKESDDTIYE